VESQKENAEPNQDLLVLLVRYRSGSGGATRDVDREGPLLFEYLQT
jgi:hypothetical protein